MTVLAGNFSLWKNVSVEFNGEEALLVNDLANRGAMAKLLYCLANMAYGEEQEVIDLMVKMRRKNGPITAKKWTGGKKKVGRRQEIGRKKTQKGPKMEKKKRKKRTGRRPERVHERKNGPKGEKKCPDLVRKLRPNVELKRKKIN